MDLKATIGRVVWKGNPRAASERLAKGERGFLADCLSRHYLGTLVPEDLAASEALPAQSDPAERLVRTEDFAAAALTYRHRGYEVCGVLPPEAVVLHALIRTYRPRVVIESGTFRGQSAVVLCEALDNVGGGEFHTVDPDEQGTLDLARERLRPFEFAQVHQGFTERVLPELLRATSGSLGVFIDGPKAGTDAFVEVLGILDLPERVRFIAVHDCELPNPSDPWFPDPKLERLRLAGWFARSRLRETHELWFMGNAWCHRHRDVWAWLPDDPKYGVREHYFSGRPQVSATAMLGIVTPRS